MAELSFVVFETKLGWMGVLGSPVGLRQVVLPQKSPGKVLALITSSTRSYRWRSSNMSLTDAEASSYLWEFVERIQEYLRGKSVAFPDRLDLPPATSFQRKVWRLVRSIPYGQTRSYSWVAEEIDIPKATRAVGQALAANPLPLVIPCHRIVGKGGNLGGFGGGVELKRRLLQLEKAQAGFMA